MTITIPDDILKAAGLTARDALIEFACRLFDAGRLDLHPAAQLAGLTRPQLESELLARRIAIYRPSVQDVADDAEALRRLGA